MERFFQGRRVTMLTGDWEDMGLQLWQMELEEAEPGHMACRMEHLLQFLFVRRGMLECQVDQHREWLSAGEGMFLNADTVYCFTDSGKGGCSLVLLSLDCGCPDSWAGADMEKYVQPIENAADFPFCRFRQDTSGGRTVIRCLEEILELTGRCTPGSKLRIKSRVLDAWAELYEEFLKREGSDGAKLREAGKLGRMLEFLHSHYREKTTLGQMAQDSGISAGEYCRFFKRHMGRTPVEYLQLYRIEQSLPALLEKPGGSIAEAALGHGFTGASYYTETFKKEMGCTPGDYRKWYQGGDGRPCPLAKRGKAAGAEAAGDGQGHMPTHLL